MIEKLMYEFYQLPKLYEKMALESGDNFNLFNVLGRQFDERSHSRFLGELLNPSGSHGQGDIFLKLFLDCCNIQNFNTTTVKVDLEYHIGGKTDAEGGKIDILIQDKNGAYIAIENKIWAGDQDAQLVRYYNFIYKNSNSRLLYLNLLGTDASNESKEGLKLDQDYKIISYQKDILAWLLLCREKASTLPFLRENISQYINIVKTLTHQNQQQKMNQEIAESIVNNPEKLAAYLNLVENQAVKNAVYNQIWQNFETNLQKCKNDNEKLELYQSLPQSNDLKYFIHLQSMEKLKSLVSVFAKNNRLELTTKNGMASPWHSLIFSSGVLKINNLTANFGFPKPIGIGLWLGLSYIDAKDKMKPAVVEALRQSGFFERFDTYGHALCLAKSGYPYPAANADKEIAINVEKMANFITESLTRVLEIINSVE